MWKYLELSRTLAALYFTQEQIVALLIEAGFNPADFALNGRGVTLWTLILHDLEHRKQVKTLAKEVLKKYPDNPVILAAASDTIEAPKSVYSGEELTWKVKGKTGKDLEKIIGEQSTLLPITFLEMGTKSAAAVARVVTNDSLGSGFLINNEGLFLTNNHVFPSKEIAFASKVQFNYQKTLAGGTARFEEIEVDLSIYETSVEDDWSLVKIKNNPSTKYGFLDLKETNVQKNDFVNIIQHPAGEHKQIGMYHNMITYCDDNIVQYLTDTMPGSSGSPVFNSKWDVVALHNSGGWIEEPGTTAEVLRNQGINMNKIRKSLLAKGFNI